MIATPIPFVPARAGTQDPKQRPIYFALGPRLRGDEREKTLTHR